MRKGEVGMRKWECGSGKWECGIRKGTAQTWGQMADASGQAAREK